MSGLKGSSKLGAALQADVTLEGLFLYGPRIPAGVHSFGCRGKALPAGVPLACVSGQGGFAFPDSHKDAF